MSVIMTSYNNAATLGYALRSIQQQTHANLEIFVVDDCSTDGTATLLAEFAAKDDRIRLMRTPENVGTYVAKNSAMAEAAGAYLTFHDSDDWAHPERIWRHVEEMEHNRATVATRSEWLRVDSTGELQFRRWGRKFQHANPASIFIREEARDQIGFFDSVRYGADSEYWFRLARVYGRRKARTLPLCLGFGRLHAASLTRSGSGAMGDENYSPVRGAYAAAYLDWHAKNAPEDLKLAPLTKKRPFRAPAEMTAGIVDVFREEMAAEAIDAATKNAQTARAIGPRPAAAAPAATPAFMFGISLASKRASGDWARTEELLGNTLRSLFNQSDDRFIVAIGGHERPSIPEMHDPRVMFIECDVAPPRKPEAYRRDKMRKRRLVAAVLRQRGGGYFFPLDADDLVHRDLVAHVLGDDNRAGYLIEHGYALDYINCRVAPIPGAWNVSFDRVCGSSAVLYFEPDELPCNGDADDQLYFNLFQSHAYWPIVAQEYERPLSSVPFAAGVYVVNHAQNLSFKLQRTGIRTQNIIQAVADHVIDGGNELLRTDFGWKILDAKSA